MAVLKFKSTGNLCPIAFISPNWCIFVITIVIYYRNLCIYKKYYYLKLFGPWSYMVQGNPSIFSIFNELNESGSNVITPAFITRFSIATRNVTYNMYQGQKS